MGNSPSKNQESVDTMRSAAIKNTSATKRRRRNSSAPNNLPEPLGIISHPYQQSHPAEYDHESSSSDEDEYYLHPRGLFQENSSPQKSSCPKEKSRRSVQSMGSLAYSESAASASSQHQNSAFDVVSKHHNRKDQKTKVVPSSEKPKSKSKKGFFRKFQKNKQNVHKDEIPFEQSLEYAKAQFYGESQDDEDEEYEENEDLNRIEAGFSQGYRSQQRNSFPPRPYHTRHGSMNGHNISVFLDDKRLPTIPDVSYQSSTAEYETEDDIQNVSNLLGDLVEHDYKEEETSMVSKEYTVETEEAKDLPSAYLSGEKTGNDSSIVSEYRRTMNSMLDKQHASYVDGQEPLEDIEMPKQNLGSLFASVNLTLNDTMNASKYKSLDDSHASGLVDNDEQDQSDCVDKRQKSTLAYDADEAKDDRGSGECDSGDEDAFSQFVANRADLSRETKIEASGEVIPCNMKGDVVTSNDTYPPIHAPQVTFENDAHSSDLQPNHDEDDTKDMDDMLSESSADDSKFDDSLYYSKSREISDVLSESTAERSKADCSLFQRNNIRIEDELSESSEDEYILDRTEFDILNRTDMTIREKSAVPFHANGSKVDMLHVLDEESSQESASKILEICNEETNTLVTRPGKQKSDEHERKPSPYPETDTKLPTTSSVANMLPPLAQDEEEEGSVFECITQQNLKEQITANPHNAAPGAVKSKSSQGSNHAIPKKPELAAGHYKGPEIGTIIQLIKRVENVNMVEMSNKVGVDESLPTRNKKDFAKLAYSRQVAKNSVFLFSDNNVRREYPHGMSKVDEERLKLICNGEDLVSLQSHAQLASCDSLESVMAKLQLIKSENRKAYSSKRRDPPVMISKCHGDLQINGDAGVKQILGETEKSAERTNDICSHFEKSLSIRSPEESSLKVGGSKRSGDEAMGDEEDTSSTKRNRLHMHTSACGDQLIYDKVEGNDEELHTSITSDDISISELQTRHSAITPMKNPKSPYIRFKKAMRMFGKTIHEAKPSTNKEPRKTPPRKNASSTKDNMFVTKVTSAQSNVQNSIKYPSHKQRRLTSGVDVIAPRKPTLTNPMFRKLPPPDENDPDKTVVAEAPDFTVENNTNDGSLQGDLGQNNSCDELQETVDSPYDERDELHLAASNGSEIESPSSSASDDDDFQDITSASSSINSGLLLSDSLTFTEIERVLNRSPGSSHNGSSHSHHEPSVLRSAMKKDKDDRNANVRVSWFAHAHETNESPESKVNRKLDQSFAHSPPNNATTTNQPATRRMRMSSFQVYSPARESLASHSPPIVFSKTIQAPVNPTQMKMHSPCCFEQPSTNAAHEESVASFSPAPLHKVCDNSTSSSTTQRKVAPAMGSAGAVLSPVTGRRTPSQNKKWTTGTTPTKNWRQLKAEQDAKKKNKTKTKKRRFSGPLKAFNH